MNRKKVLTITGCLIVVIVALVCVVGIVKMTSSAKMEKEDIGSVFKDAPVNVIVYGFDEVEYTISEKADIDAIIEALQTGEYEKLPEEEYVEGLYTVDLVYEAETISVGIDNNHVAFNGKQYLVSGDFLREATDIIKSYIED